MGLLRQLRATAQTYSNSLRDPPAWLTGGAEAYSGSVVTEQTALGCVAFHVAARIPAEDLASVPLKIFEKTSEGRREATEHPAYRLLHDEPNPMMSAMTLREALIFHARYVGNGFAHIEYDKAFRVKHIWLLRPDLMRVARENGHLRYYARAEPSAPEEPFEDWEIIHVPGWGWDGTVGMSPVRVLMQTIGMDLSAEEYGARFFGQGAQPGGVLETEQTIANDQFAVRRKEWEEAHQGPRRAYRVAVLDRGLTWKQVTLKPEEAQFLATRQFQLRQIAMWMRVPLHKLADLERATFSNIEHQSIEYATSSLRPWGVRLEQEINRKVFSSAQRSRYYTKHNLDALLQGDFKSRVEGLTLLRQWGIIDADQARELHEWNPLPDGQGKIVLVPLNMIPANQAGQPALPAGDPEPEIAPAADPSDPTERFASRIAHAYRRLWVDLGERIYRREAKALRRLAAKLSEKGFDIDAAARWAEQFHGDQGPYLSRSIDVLIRSMLDQVVGVGAEAAGTGVPALAEQITAELRQASTDRLLEALGGEQPAQDLVALIDQFEKREAAEFGARAGMRAAQFVATGTWQQRGAA